MNEKCKVFLSEILKNLKKWYHTSTCLKTGSLTGLFCDLLGNGQTIHKWRTPGLNLYRLKN
jgi:hypothetical protein